MSRVILTGYVVIPEKDRERIETALPEHIRTTRAEPGCIVFKVEQDADNPLRFNVYEEFESKSAFEAHQARIVGTEWARTTINMERHFNFLAK